MINHLKNKFLEYPFVYKLWQRPFINKKVFPLLGQEELWNEKNVLDVGCGPATNTLLFKTAKNYIGVDINADYISKAKLLYPERSFICHDVSHKLKLDQKPDLIFCNSLLHHLSDDEVESLLAWLKPICNEQTKIDLIDLLLPPNYGLPYFLAKADRGDFARKEAHWRKLLSKEITSLSLEPFSIGLFGIDRWDLVYIRGNLKNA